MTTLTVLLAADDRSRAQATLDRLDRLRVATSLIEIDPATPRLPNSVLGDVQGADAVLAIGGEDSWRSIPMQSAVALARLQGRLAVHHLDGGAGTAADAEPLDASLARLLSRPGLASYAAASSGEPGALAAWAQANPDDPLAESAAGGVDPDTLQAAVDRALRERGAAGVAAAPTRVSWSQVRDHAAPVPLVVAALTLPLAAWSLRSGPSQIWIDAGSVAAVTAVALSADGLATLAAGSKAGGKGSGLGRWALALGFSAVIALALAAIWALAAWAAPGDHSGHILLAAVAAAGLIVTAPVVHGLAWLWRAKGRAFTLLSTLGLPVLALLAAYGLALAWPAQAQLTKQAVNGLARVGFNPYAYSVDVKDGEIDWDAANRRAVEAFQRANNQPVTGRIDGALLRTLSALPDKTEFLVAADGSGDARSPLEALERAGGDKLVIRIKPGVYRMKQRVYQAAALDLTASWTQQHDTGRDRSVTLLGLGDARDIVLESAAPDPVVQIGPGDRVENLSIRLSGEDSGTPIHIGGPIDASYLLGPDKKPLSPATLTRTRISSSSKFAPVYVDASVLLPPVVEDNDILDVPGQGIAIQASGGAVIKGNRITRSGDTAIEVTGDAAPTVSGNVVAGGGGNGIHVGDAARGLYSGNTIDGKGSTAVLVMGTAAPMIDGNTIRGTTGNCLYSGEQAQPIFRRNQLSGCVRGDFFPAYVADKSRAIFEGNTGLTRSQAGSQPGGKVDWR